MPCNTLKLTIFTVWWKMYLLCLGSQFFFCSFNSCTFKAQGSWKGIDKKNAVGRLDWSCKTTRMFGFQSTPGKFNSGATQQRNGV